MTASRLLAFVLALGVLGPGDPVKPVDVTAVARDGRVHVSCALAGTRLDELDEPIRAGLTTSITFEADLRRPLWWFDRAMASATVVASVQHDTLTGRYQLTRTIDGRNDDTLVTNDAEAARRFLASFARLALFSTADLQANVEYVVHVKVRTRPRVAWSFWPWDSGAVSGTARFTFIP